MGQPDEHCLRCLHKFETVRTLTVRSKRAIFGAIRAQSNLTPETYLPAYGLRCGEFAVFQILTETSRRSRRSQEEASTKEPTEEE